MLRTREGQKHFSQCKAQLKQTNPAVCVSSKFANAAGEGEVVIDAYVKMLAVFFTGYFNSTHCVVIF